VSLLEVKNLSMHYWTRKGEVKAVDDVSFTIEKGEAIGLVGESGCGKTSMALTLLKLLPENAKILQGSILFSREGATLDLVRLREDEMQRVRWKGIAMIFQAAMNSWNPVYRVGDQIIEAMQQHKRGLRVQDAKKRIADLFQMVGLDSQMMERYPHEYSGGMKQRAVIAMALSCEPDLIIADEPTTALDVIVQDKILRELRQIQKKLQMSMIYISHDIAVIAEVADRIGVMYGGKLVEMAETESIFRRPVHPYTQALMSSFPNLRGEKKRLETLPGEPPDLINPPSGCRFHPRCRYGTELCKTQDPRLRVHREKQQAACWNPLP
jgi:peptide/nickel transport system ATP-binding protein